MTLHYTYSTAGEDGVKLGYSLERETERTSHALAAAEKGAYGSIWLEEPIALKKARLSLRGYAPLIER